MPEIKGQTVEDIEKLFRQMETAPSPTDVQVGDIAFQGNADYPLTMTVSEIQDAGWFPVWHTKDRDIRLINKNMLPSILRKKRQDGLPAFTMTKPKEPPNRGTKLCWLHPDSPKRAMADALFLGECGIDGAKPKSNIPNERQVIRHMQKKHSDEYATIAAHEKSIKDAEKEQSERDWRIAMLGARNNEVVAPTPAVVPSRPSGGHRSNGNAFTCAHGCGKTIKNQKLHDRNSHS
jgi:hypothetical protein